MPTEKLTPWIKMRSGTSLASRYLKDEPILVAARLGMVTRGRQVNPQGDDKGGEYFSPLQQQEESVGDNGLEQIVFL